MHAVGSFPCGKKNLGKKDENYDGSYELLNWNFASYRYVKEDDEHG